MKRVYEAPQLIADVFVANEYVAACKEPMYDVTPTQVKCTSPGHQNTQVTTMFLDSQNACIVKFVPQVGSADGDKFRTKFNACYSKVGCNQQNWQDVHYTWDRGKKVHASSFIDHDTVIDLSLAQKYNLS